MNSDAFGLDLRTEQCGDSLVDNFVIKRDSCSLWTRATSFLVRKPKAVGTLPESCTMNDTGPLFKYWVKIWGSHDFRQKVGESFIAAVSRACFNPDFSRPKRWISSFKLISSAEPIRFYQIWELHVHFVSAKPHVMDAKVLRFMCPLVVAENHFVFSPSLEGRSRTLYLNAFVHIEENYCVVDCVRDENLCDKTQEGPASFACALYHTCPL